ncbi:MAG: HAD family hydrolase [Candidatus Thorarchaeota archaeon]
MPNIQKFGSKNAILFDFDNTLLFLDEEQFINRYFSLIAKRFIDKMSPSIFIDYMKRATLAMTMGDDKNQNNIEKFLLKFEILSGLDQEYILNKFKEFYTTEFPQLRSLCKTHPYAKKCLQKAIDKDYKVIIATNPLFPEPASDARLNWAGLLDLKEKITLITTGEIMHYTKPDIKYYHEILEIINEKPENCVMIGNDYLNDGIASSIGIDVYLTTDFKDRKIETEPHFLDKQSQKLSTNKNIKIKFTGTLEYLYNNL